MSPQAQRIAIAKACPDLFAVGELHPGFWVVYWKDSFDKIGIEARGVDPLNELNVIHMIEKTLTDEQWRIYSLNLGPLTSMRVRDYIGADAPTRLAGLLRTLNLWDDSL